MTKTLTEQWREGTLKSGNYYTVCYKGWSGETFSCNLYYSERIGFDANVKEVLASVPTYAEFMDLMSNLEYIDKYRELVSKTEQLEKKLEIATKALKEYADRTNWTYGCFMCVYDGKSFADEESAEQALKEMEGVK